MNDDRSFQHLSRNFIKKWQSGITEIEAFTSGSTGTPKRILLPRRLMEESALRSIRHFGLNESSIVHLSLSPEYIAGKMCIVRALMAGCRLTTEDASSHPLTSADTPPEITLLSAVGAQIPGMLELKAKGKLPHIKHLLFGGSPLALSLRHDALTLADNVWESYGMTETASHIALRRVCIAPEPFSALPDIYVSTDARGCLIIDMPTAGRIVTNDLARLVDDKHFFILGRADNVLITGGLKVIPELVEQKLNPYLPEHAYYITSQPHPKWGEQVILVMEDTQVNEECTIDAADFMIAGESLYELSHRILEPHERPAKVYKTHAIPRTSSGKIIRTKRL